MATTATSGLAMLAIAWLATRRLTPTELGFFFSFLSLGAIVQLADFGLSYAALQKAGEFRGTGRTLDLAGLASLVSRWNLLATTFGVTLAGILGFVSFSSVRTPAAESLSLAGPWLGYLAGTVLAQVRVPAISLREGSGRIAEMWSLRLCQEWIAALVCLVALDRGAGLWSLALLAATRGLVATAWLSSAAPLVVGTQRPPFPVRRWFSEMWPFQWRIGLSVLSGFFIFRAISPVLLVEKGPISAGQFGLAVALMNLLLAVTSAWPMSHAARYSSLLAAKQSEQLRREFPRLLWLSTALAILLAGTAAGAIWWARSHQITFALRLPEYPVVVMLLAAAVAHHVVSCLAMYLRAEGREPMLLPSVLGGMFTLAAVWVTAHLGTPREIAAVYLACSAGGIPIAGAILRRRHRPPGPGTVPMALGSDQTGTSGDLPQSNATPVRGSS